MASITLSNTFNRFFDSEKSIGLLLIVCTLISLGIANSPVGPTFWSFWQRHIAGLRLERWINEALMAVFFLLIGLELERELHVGALSNFRNDLLPIPAAAGGMVAPAPIHYSLNSPDG